MYLKGIVLLTICALLSDIADAGCLQYKTYKAGSSCKSIASANSLSVNQLEALNSGLSCTSSLKKSTKLCVKGSTASSQAKTTSTTKATKTTGSSSSCGKTYTIKSGDTCYAIEQQYGISTSQWQTLNPKVNCDDLQIGQVVCIGSSSTATSTSKPSPTSTVNVCHSYTDNFKSKQRIVSDWKYNGDPKSADWIDISGDPNTWNIGANGLELRVLSPGKVVRTGHHNNKVGQGSTLNSTYELNYGAIEAKIKMSPVPGIVTAFITMSDRGDEVDWEWVGGSTTHAQSNYYYDGIADYTKGKIHPITPAGQPNGPLIDDSQNWNIFRLELQPDHLNFLINGNLVRTVFRNQTGQGNPPVYHYPSQTTRVQVGLWDSSTDDGTAQWANGPVDWNSLGSYVSGYVEYIKIECDPRYNKVVTY